MLFTIWCCALSHRPSKYNKHFLNDFSEFLAAIIKNYDRVLIVGNFNIHVCCPNMPMAKDFLSVIDSFNLVQSVSGSIHEHEHTLDLVLSWFSCVVLCFQIICQYYFRLISHALQLN